MTAKKVPERPNARRRDPRGTPSGTAGLYAYPCEVTRCQNVGERLQTTLKELSNIKYALDQAAIIAIADSQGIIKYVNDKFCEISQYEESELIGHTYRLLNSGYHSLEFFQNLWQTISSGQVWQGEIKDRAKNGQDYWVDTTIVPFLNEQGRPFQYLTIQFEITERKLAEEALRESESRYHTLVNLSPVGIFSADAQGQFLDVNDRWCEMTGFPSVAAIGEGWTRTIHPEDRDRVLIDWYQAVQKRLPFKSAEYRLQRPDGSVIWVFSQAVAETGSLGNDIGYVGTIIDITERRQAEEQLRYNAWHDPLTGLPNRALFLNSLETAMQRVRQQPNTLFAVLFLDLDRFKVINDSLGHLAGDRLLSGVARRLTHTLRSLQDGKPDSERSRYIVARLGGDEFTILLQDISEPSQAIEVVERIQRELAQPFLIDGHEVFTSASIGIAISGSPQLECANSPNHAVIVHERSTDVLRDADTAMYTAKERGSIGRYAVFNQAMYAKALALLQLENDLKRAVATCQEFVLHYQPLIDLETNQITGFEALVRWQHPTRGLVPPSEFIPLAEETGLIVPLGRWVLLQAASQLRIWQLVFPEKMPLTMSINLSPKQFAHPGLVSQIDRVLQETGVEGSSLNLEITESALIENPETTAAMLSQLKRRHINLSIDDFGTGYSSLSNLARFPLDTLKIDRSFVSQMGDEGENSAIVWTIVTLAHNLGMNVVAEGVETQQQIRQLKKLQCEQCQGHFYSKPLDAKSAGCLLAMRLSSRGEVFMREVGR